MDYAIYDAFANGCRHVVVIIRKITLDRFDVWLQKWALSAVQIDLVFQQGTLTNSLSPLGTAHAVWCARPLLKSKFVVVNADDYYGQLSFQLVFNFLKNSYTAADFCMPGYTLSTTLSEHGSVSRGICNLDVAGILISITERKNIVREENKIVSLDGQWPVGLPDNSIVSMNMWGFDIGLFETLCCYFDESNLQNRTDEFYLPQLVQQLIDKKACRVTVLPGNDDWLGITYAQDKLNATVKLSHLAASGFYPTNLYDSCKT